MKLIIDDDVKSVAEFMQQNIASSRLLTVAKQLNALATVIWSEDQAPAVRLTEDQSASEPKAAIQ